MAAAVTKNLYTVLIVDDETNIRRALEQILTHEGYTVITAESGKKAIELAANQKVDVLISDLIMPGMEGVEVIQKIKEFQPHCSALILTAYGSIRSAVDAIRYGAFDYLQKPFDIEEVPRVVKQALEFSSRTSGKSMAGSKEPLHTANDSPLQYAEPLQCLSLKMQEVYKIVHNAARSKATVLIRGESGTGKELIARSLHKQSQRASGPYIAVSCAALPETLLESELFGHEKNAFTGAAAAKPGRFELADRGTIFLDEIGDISPVVQVKLLRVLENWEFERLGAVKSTHVDVRLIAATHKDLEQAVQENKFRQDLYYRLNVITISIPALRERSEDILPLTYFFLNIFNQENDRCINNIHPETEAILSSYAWPGNIRELENSIEHAVVLSPLDSDTLMPDMLPLSILRDMQRSSLSNL